MWTQDLTKQESASVSGRRFRVGAGFAMVEAVVAMAIVLALLAILAVWAEDVRRNARMGQDLASLRHYGTGTQAYVADNVDRLWGFSWTPGNMPGADPDLAGVASALDAAASQAVQILRDRGGRPDIQRVSAWLPHVTYSHLVLADYMNEGLPDRSAVSSGDAHRLLWRDDPAGFDAGLYTPRPYTASKASNADKRWPYSSSWHLGVAFFDRATTLTARLRWSVSQSTFQTPGNAVLGAPFMSDVRFPSQKALMFDEYQRHFGERQAFYGYDESRVPVLAADGAVAVRSASDGNLGWDPQSPSRTMSVGSFYMYEIPFDPRLIWMPRPLNGDFFDSRIGDRFMWTRGGIEGRDFNGPQINTGQW